MKAKYSPTTRVTFTYKDGFNNKVTETVSYDRFKYYAVSLLEDEMNDVVKDISFTIDGITTKLDYYNAENL